MKVFISSTIYDLIDLRAELFHHLIDIGADPFLSEMHLSSFDVSFDKSSIETCLENCRTADFFILIIDKRYGPSLVDFGYGDLSATHLEYLEAKKFNKPIILLVRDRTFSDYSIHKKGKFKEPFSGTWVPQKENRVFEIVRDHISLKTKDKQNWYYTFANSLELKKIVSNIFKVKLVKEKLPEKISNGEFSLLNVVLDIEYPNKNDNSVTKFECIVKNQGKHAVFILQFQWEDQSVKDNDNILSNILAPNSELLITFISRGNARIEKYLLIKYANYEGITVSERYRIIGERSDGIIPGALRTRINNIERVFSIGEPISIDI